MADEYIVDRLYASIYRALPPAPWRAMLDPVAALVELRAWVDDDHQWSADTQWLNWLSLIDDVEHTFGKLPHTVAAHLARSIAAPLATLKSAQADLQRHKQRALQAPLRSKLDQSENVLRQCLSDPAVLATSWKELTRAVKASDRGREQEALALLAALAEFQGQPWEPLSKRIWQVLGDDEITITALRAELAGKPHPEPRLPPRPAGLPAGERLALAERLLDHPAARADRVVWLAYLEAHVPQFHLKLGNAVALYEGRWLVDVLTHWESSGHAHSEVPAEVSAHLDECLSSWNREGGDDRPFALMRIALGQGLVAQARDEAQATAEVLLQLAAFYSNGRVSWRAVGSFIVFADGRLDWRTLGLGSAGQESGSNLVLAQDRTSTILEELKPTIAPHLPVKDPRVRLALDLLRWLVEARRAWDPAKFLLCDRIVERVSGWAREPDPSRFARNYLALYWARQELMSDIADATLHGVYAIDRGVIEHSGPERRAAFLEAVGPKKLVRQEPGMRETVNLQQALIEMSWLRKWQRPGTDAAVELDALDKRLGTARAAERSLRALEIEFNTLLGRARRTRNAVAHGGPIPGGTLRSVGRFFEEVASDALNQALYAHMIGRDVRKHFAERQTRHEQALNALQQGTDPWQALFWKS